jgi:hypothetical protein
MRSTLVAAVAAASLLVPASTALAQDPAPEQAVPPAFVPPTPAPVVDEASAENFARLYVARNASRLLRESQRRTLVTDVQARCLEHPVVADRFGCVFTLRAAVFQQRRRGHDGHYGKASKRGRDRDRDRRVRVRQFGCLGLLTITGGPTVTPSAQLRLAECARVPRGDYLAPEPVV